jgi:hypothetical protein
MDVFRSKLLGLLIGAFYEMENPTTHVATTKSLRDADSYMRALLAKELYENDPMFHTRVDTFFRAISTEAEAMAKRTYLEVKDVLGRVL